MFPVSRGFLAWFLGLGAILSFLMALAIGLYTWHFRQTAIQTSGQVVELRAEMDEGDTTYRAVFRFLDAAGKEHTVPSSMKSKPATHHVGDQVTILYPPGDPERAQIDNFWELWFTTAVPAFISAAFALWFFLAMRGRATHSKTNTALDGKQTSTT
jgi:hypothetical protein